MRDPLLTDRLILRDVTEADAELLFDLDSDPQVMRYIGTQPSSDPAWYRERIRTAYTPWQDHPWHGVRLILERPTGEFLGWVFVRPAPSSINAGELGWTRPDEIEIGYRLRRASWGQGIATEAAVPLIRIALDDRATASIVACATAGNSASLRVLEKLGLQRVGEVVLSGQNEPTIKLILTRRGETFLR